MKKILSLILFGLQILSLFSFPCYAAETLYQGYNELIALNGEKPPAHTGLRIKDGIGADGKDNIVYCYNLEKSYPTSENATYYENDLSQGEDDRCFYTRIENYLESHDDYIEKYVNTKIHIDIM